MLASVPEHVPQPKIACKSLIFLTTQVMDTDKRMERRAAGLKQGGPSRVPAPLVSEMEVIARKRISEQIRESKAHAKGQAARNRAVPCLIPADQSIRSPGRVSAPLL